MIEVEANPRCDNGAHRRIPRRRLFPAVVIAACLSIGLNIGCAPSVILKPPIEWPIEWRGRQLYNTPRALIYATSAAAAGEADRLTNNIAAEHNLPAPTDAQPRKGLIIVADRGDEPVCNELEELLTLVIKGQAQLAGLDKPSDARIAQVRERLAGDQSPFGPILKPLLAMLPLPITDADVSKTFELPADATPALAWAGVLPTDALVRDKSATLIDLALQMAIEKNELSAGASWMIKPMVPMIRNMLASEIRKMRDITFVNIVRQNDPNWIADREARKAAIAEWPIVCRAGGSKAAYDASYAKIRSAADRLPHDAQVLRTLAAAAYRTERFDLTIATLDQIRELERKHIDSSEAGTLSDVARVLMPSASNAVDNAVTQASVSRPSDLAFRAMAEHRLGRTDDADKTFDQLAQLIETRHKDNMSERVYLTESARLLGKPCETTTRPASP